MIKTISVAQTRRASRRQNFMLRASVTTEAGVVHTGRVRDLSAEGVKIELDAVPDVPMPRGTCVTIELRNIGKVKAEIVWRRSNWYGLKLARRIDPERAIRPVGKGARTPDHLKPVLLPSRSLKYVAGL